MNQQHWILAGWLLFIASALFFIAARWHAGGGLALTGGIFFLFACFAFLVPVLRTWRRIRLFSSAGIFAKRTAKESCHG